MGDVLIILGSPRARGNTSAAAECLRAELSLMPEQVIDLRLCRIEPFEYGAKLARDDFHAVIARMLDHQEIVFATPVYWYAMSGLMKTFFDRLTDLLVDAEVKRLGRALAGRRVWLLATGTDETLPHGFTVPFEKTASYFDMRWKAAFYVHVDAAASPGAQNLRTVLALAAAIARSDDG
jgi:putative NADPH-quinone reductase